MPLAIEEERAIDTALNSLHLLRHYSAWEFRKAA
jgi:hypothetical protein